MIPSLLKIIDKTDEIIINKSEPQGNNRKEVWLQKSKNIFDGFFRTLEDNANGTVDGNKYTSTSRVGLSTFVYKQKLKNNEELTLSFKNLTQGAEFKYALSDNDLTVSDLITQETYTNGSVITNNLHIENTENKKYLYISFRMGLNQTSAIVEDIQIEHNSAATAYEPYIEPKAFTLNSNNVYEEFKDSNEDTGWIKASLTSSFTPYGSHDDYTPKYRRCGKLVEICGKVKPTAEIAGSDNVILIFTLPVGFRPSKSIASLRQGSGKNSWLLQIDPSGAVTFSRYGISSFINCSINEWLPFHETFLAD